MAREIKSKKELLETVHYVAKETSRLAKTILGKSFPIISLTVFSHSDFEYQTLIKILETMGKPFNFNNGPRVALHEPIRVGDNQILHLRVRKPDPERPQVGCNDFEADYESFKKEYLHTYPDAIRLIKRSEYEMIELRHPDFDVLAYIVSP